jgi:hypothetical protein
MNESPDARHLNLSVAFTKKVDLGAPHRKTDAATRRLG